MSILVKALTGAAVVGTGITAIVIDISKSKEVDYKNISDRDLWNLVVEKCGGRTRDFDNQKDEQEWEECENEIWAKWENANGNPRKFVRE